MKFLKILTVLILLGVALIAVFISISKCTNQNSNNDATVSIHSEFPVAGNLNEMTKAANFIVIGKYESFNSKWNMARNSENPKLEDDDMYVEGHLYNFVVDEVIKGEALDKNVLVNLTYLTRDIYIDSDQVVNDEGIVIKEATTSKKYYAYNKNFHFIEPEIGAKYMLFLNKSGLMQNYYGAIEPFQIKFDNNNIAKLQSKLISNNQRIITDNIIQINKNKKVTFQTIIDEKITDAISGMNINTLKQEINKYKR